MTDVSIIIVNFNGGSYIRDCLQSVFQQDFPSVEVIVVDNASTDTSIDIIKEFPVRLYTLPQNKGFGRANNDGVRLAHGKYIVLLNPDTIVEKEWLKSLVMTIEKDKTVGAVVSKIYLGSSDYIDSAGSCYNSILNAWSRGVYERDRGQYDKEEEVSMATACSMIFRKDILDRTYLFDPDFFMYMEELDFCIRIRNLGCRILYQPASVVHHIKSQSVREVCRQEVFFKQYHGNINRAKMIGRYLSCTEILRRLHMILASFLYWDWYFFVHGRWWLLGKMIFYEAYYFIKGLCTRDELTRQKKWQQWMQHMSLSDLIHFKKDIEWKQYLYEKKS